MTSPTEAGSMEHYLLAPLLLHDQFSRPEYPFYRVGGFI
jgi:hypothetical protein